MALLQRGFNDPAYQARFALNYNLIGQGSGGSTGKFVAHAALLLFSLTSQMTIAGTSTYTNTVGGVGTSVINGQQLNVVIIQNTATAGQAAALATTTIGPFIAGGTFASGGTGTGQVGGINQFAINTSTGQAGVGGYPVPLGATIQVVSGTDATAVNALVIDYALQQQAPLTY